MSFDTTRTEILARRWRTPHARAHAMLLFYDSDHFFVNDTASACVTACVRPLRLAFREPPISAVLGRRGADPPAVAVTTVWHACIITDDMCNAHAAYHAARTHFKRKGDRPVPEPGLAAACSAAQVHTACMFMHALFFE